MVELIYCGVFIVIFAAKVWLISTGVLEN